MLNEVDIKASRRAGQYVTQTAGYSAFIPELVPPNPPVRIDGELQSRLSEADRALGRLDGSIYTLPSPELFVYMYVRKEAVLSSQIEGTRSSLQDLLSTEADISSAEIPPDVGEVVNYVRAMNHGLTRLDALPVSVRLIREIHANLLQGVRRSHLTPGELRRSQNWIGPEGSSLARATFVPPPPDAVPAAMANLEAFLHEDRDVPLLIKIGMAHAQFETIHPFLEGNGRVGRLLITCLLYERRALAKPVLYLSQYFKAHREAYYERLQAVRESGDWEGWLEFFLRGVSEVSTQATETTRRILLLREQHRSRIVEALGRAAGNGHRILEHLYQHPIVSAKQVQTLIGTTFAGANQIVHRLVAAGILQEITGHSRHRRFRYEPYVRLFDEG